MTAALVSAQSLPLRDKLAQLLFVRVGSNLPPVRTVEEDADRVSELLKRYPLGGLLLFNGQQELTARTLKRLQQVARIPLLVGADIERGIGQQIRGYTLFPHAMAFDALGEDAEQHVFEFARLTGIAARAHGIHITFSPLADVNIEPRNPIIATRAFASDPQRVAQLVTAFISGSRAGGVLCTAKHFPGHGSTYEDSHHALPMVQASREELAVRELVPFRAAIQAAVPLLMSAHVQFPAWDPSGNPATLSRPILHDLLRHELGFAGAVVSDSLLMEGVKPRFSDEGELVLHSLIAGVDLQLDVTEPGKVLDVLEQAISDGSLSPMRVDEAFQRLLALKQMMFAGPTSSAAESQPLNDVLDASERLANLVARNSIRRMVGKKVLTPFSREQSLCMTVLRPHQSHLDPDELPLGRFLRERFSQCEYLELGPGAPTDDYSRAIKQALAADQYAIAVVVKPAAWYRFGLLPEQDTFVRNVIAQRECTLVSLGSPVVLGDYADATERVCAYSDVFVSQSAIADFLAGDNARKQ